MGLQITTTGEIETLQLLNGFLIKVLGRVEIPVLVNKNEVMINSALINETFDYVILGREGLSSLSPNWNKHLAVIVEKTNDVSYQKDLLADNKIIQDFSKVLTSNRV